MAMLLLYESLNVGDGKSTGLSSTSDPEDSYHIDIHHYKSILPPSAEPGPIVWC